MAKIQTTNGPVNMKIVDLEGEEVKTRRQMRNSMIEVPKGAKGVVYTATPRWGLAIHFEPCRHCGAKAVMSKVRPSDIILVVRDG
jgi:hypothetical protein